MIFLRSSFIPLKLFLQSDFLRKSIFKGVESKVNSILELNMPELILTKPVASLQLKLSSCLFLINRYKYLLSNSILEYLFKNIPRIDGRITLLKILPLNYISILNLFN